MTRKLSLSARIFEQEWNKRFVLPKKDSKIESLSNKDVEPPKDKPSQDRLREEETKGSEEIDLTEEELQEQALAEEIGDFLDEIERKLESGEKGPESK